jgi:hypothetical protein
VEEKIGDVDNRRSLQARTLRTAGLPKMSRKGVAFVYEVRVQFCATYPTVVSLALNF